MYNLVFRYNEHLGKGTILDEDISDMRKTNLHYFISPLFTANCSYDGTKRTFFINVCYSNPVSAHQNEDIFLRKISGIFFF